MTTWKEHVAEWEKTGRRAAGKIIEGAMLNGHAVALLRLLDEVENACYAVRYFVERNNKVAAEQLQNGGHGDTTFERRYVSGTALYYLLEPLRNCLGRELVMLGELARDADKPGKEGNT